MKEAPGSSETSVLTRATRRNNPEDTILPVIHFPKFIVTELVGTFLYRRRISVITVFTKAHNLPYPEIY
jgi:hypothetical protein